EFFGDHNRLLNSIIRNTGCHGIAPDGISHEFSHNKVIGPPRGPEGTLGGQCYPVGSNTSLHAIYTAASDSVFDSNEFVTWTAGYTYHQYNSGGVCPVSFRNVFSNNYIHDSGAPMLLGCG